MKNTVDSMRHWFTRLLERTEAKFSVLVALTLTLALTYGGGLWLHLLHQANGATELNQPPPVIHWLRDSTLMLPLVLVSVFTALVFAQWLLVRFGPATPLILESIVVVASVALITSVVLAWASPIHDSLFRAQHPARHHQGDAKVLLALQQDDEAETSFALQHDDAETSFALQHDDEEMLTVPHILYDGSLALVGNLVLSSILFALFRGRLWGRRAARRIRVVKPALPARMSRG
ncbi:MAG: hypothetical protein HZC40_16670 [Chloroflexi bacterium]|nr:hypothetical protein [Chloroflexota bacterium]